jgi:hypothetical protein
MTLGDLIRSLELISDKNLPVRFDFCNFVPYSLASYRGYYDQLAIEPISSDSWTESEGPGSAHPNVQYVIDLLKDALGKRFTGWKGGEFLMTEQTKLWVDAPGKWSSTAVSGVLNRGWIVIIETRNED